MRLFTAILFDAKSIDILYDSVNYLKKFASGSFTMKENMHLTVNFIGETEDLKVIKQAMQYAVDMNDVRSFELFLRGFGKFKRNEGDIFWIGVEKENTLWRLQKELGKNLKAVGLKDLDDREYRPHLTLGRKIKVGQGFQKDEFEAGIIPVKVEVKKISLMKSERLQGKLVYTEIFSVDLKNK